MAGRHLAAPLIPLVVAALTAVRPVAAEPGPSLTTPPPLVSSATAASASLPLAVAAATAVTAPDPGEVGIEYQLSVRDAESYLDRLSASWQRLVEQAMTYLGTPYRSGGTSRRGLDCSGLVGAVYGEQGLDLPRTAVEQYREGAPIVESDLRPGDLVFFRDTYKRGISHVGIYLGDGRFIHAAGHRRGVVVSELSRPYYRSRYAGARRLAAQPGTAAAATAHTAPDGLSATTAPAAAPMPAVAPSVSIAPLAPLAPVNASGASGASGATDAVAASAAPATRPRHR